ncbi:MAG: hypothetical protein NUW37_15200 [Planctomycetes bacterium]|nr:hypothetical protein [Planctomycetota bacterium]
MRRKWMTMALIALATAGIAACESSGISSPLPKAGGSAQAQESSVSVASANSPVYFRFDGEGVNAHRGGTLGGFQGSDVRLINPVHGYEIPLGYGFISKFTCMCVCVCVIFALRLQRISTFYGDRK